MWLCDCEGKELEKRSSVNLHWRNGTRDGYCTSDWSGLVNHERCLTFVPSWLSLCICRHWPRYIKLSLIFPASASVAPAVFAFRARSEPVTVISISPASPSEYGSRLTGQIDDSEVSTTPRIRHASSGPLFDLDTEEAMTSRANTVTSGPRNSSLV